MFTTIITITVVFVVAKATETNIVQSFDSELQDQEAMYKLERYSGRVE